MIFSSVIGYRQCNKMKSEDITEPARLKFYVQTIIDAFIPLIMIIVFLFISGHTFADIGIRPLNLKPAGWLTILTYILNGTLLLLILYQTIMLLFFADYKAKIKETIKQAEGKGKHYDIIIYKLMLPRTKREKQYFSFLSLTAGISEELIYRGTTMFLLLNIFSSLNFLIAGIISSLIFGFMHIYQGFIGIIKAGFSGAIFLLLYYTTDSLIPGIILHFLVDVSSAFLVPTEKTDNN